jgi:hypothetical protein
MTECRRVIVFAKRPMPGEAKTRLGATLGDAQAAGVYARLLYAYLLNLIGSDLFIELSLSSADDVSFFGAAFPETDVTVQSEGDLGTRMRMAFERAFAQGCEQVVLTGSDIPALDSTLVASAFGRLADNPQSVVLGPAADGGYYLVGMAAPAADIFDGIAWSTGRVLEQSLARLAREGRPVTLLRQLEDLDDEAAYHRWCARLARK